MIVCTATHPNLKIGLKRKELVCGKRYVIKEKIRCGIGHVYRHVFLVDLISGNQAVVQWDEDTFDKIIGEKDRKRVTKVRTVKVSCATFLATEEDWDRFPKHWNASRRRLELDYTEIQGEQVAVDMDALRRGVTPEVDAPPPDNGFVCNRVGSGHWFGSSHCPECRS